MELADRWILSKFNRTIEQMAESLESFRFNDAAHLIYDFIWHDFCDWYLEIIKPRVEYGGEERSFVLLNAAHILTGSMQLLHPIMPFITEEIWQRLTDILVDKPAKSIMISRWPAFNSSLIDKTAEDHMETVKSLIGTIRNIRNEMNLPPGKKADVIVVPADDETYQLLFDNMSYILDLASVKNLKLDKDATRPQKSAAGISDKSEVFVLLEGLVDFEREKARLKKEIERRKKFITNIEGKLINQGFLSKAPKDVIKLERSKLNDSRHDLEKLSANLEALGE